MPRGRRRAQPPVPHLFEVLDCATPLRSPARHSLAGVDEVLLCRGDERRVERDGATLRLFIPDRFMSGVHARMRRQGDGFQLEDARSKNGTLVNGAAPTGAPLADTDQIEVGRTQLLYRSAVPPGEGAADVDARAVAGP